MPSQLHTPVLLDRVRDIFCSLKKSHDRVIVDATLGIGGHTSEILRFLGKGDILIGFDRDGENLEKAKSHIASEHVCRDDGYDFFTEKGARVILIHSSFAHIREKLQEKSISHIDFILYDLGVSSVHYDEGERGFSTRFDGPLDMRFDRSRGLSARDLVMSLDERELVRIFTLYGEEKKSWFIAKEILKARKSDVLDTTGKLLALITRSSYDPKSPIRVFQALRIAVNEEFSHIETSLKDAIDLLAPGGLMLVITFHSLEDRLVKHFFDPYLRDVIDDVTGQIRIPAGYEKYTRKPIEPTDEEREHNHRSRSAKMRVIERRMG